MPSMHEFHAHRCHLTMTMTWWRWGMEVSLKCSVGVCAQVADECVRGAEGGAVRGLCM